MKIFLGLSGGVDSAVAAYLLKQQGHEVVCGFMRNWDSAANNDLFGNDTLEQEVCTQESDYNDAKAIADKLNLPLIRVDFIEEYWRDVFNVFIQQTKEGFTPNPDILCNRYIKFDQFFEHGRRLGFDTLATGHYARIITVDDQARLGRARDHHKDQSYFLDQVRQEALNHTLFPLGDLTKQEVRKIAKELDLKVADKKDSTGICFIGERHYQQFLTNYLAKRTGDIVDISSQRVLGQHQGVMFYTIGQRHGLDISTAVGPWYVCAKDIETNTIYVAKGSKNPALEAQKIIVDRVNWYDSRTELDGTVKLRYRQKDQPCAIRFNKDEIIVDFKTPVHSVAAGQEAVFYDGELVLGGGRIKDVFNDNKQQLQWIKEQMHETVTTHG